MAVPSSRTSVDNIHPTTFHPHFSDEDHCLNRVPYSSLSAFLLCLFGVILFTTMMFWAFNATVEMVRRTTFITDLPWLDKFQLVFIISAVAMLLVSLSFLVVGLLSTGQTREKIFHRQQARRGGRAFCVVGICLASLLNMIWILILAFTAIMCFIFAFFSALCSTVNHSTGHGGCLNLSVVRPLLPPTETGASATLEFCDGQLQQFCALSNTIVLWYFAGLLGSLLICMGLVQFITTHAINFAQIGNEARSAELLDILHAEINAGTEEKLGKFSGNGIWHPPQQVRPSFPGDQQQLCEFRSRQQHFDRNGTHNNDNHHHRRYQSHNQQHHQHHHFESRNPSPPIGGRGKSVGAMVDTHRRHSYQKSLHGSNNFLNDGTPQKQHSPADFY